MNETLVARARQAVSLVDLTSLGDDDVQADIEELCEAAQTPFGHVAAVCVQPQFVGLAVSRLEWTGISVASVANFPEGDADIDVVSADARRIIEAGGDEVEVVFPWQALAGGQEGFGQTLVEKTRESIGDQSCLKVILESGELDDDVLRAACVEALDAGADFLQTSTGTTPISATPAAARVMLETIAGHDRSAGLKVSGGLDSTPRAVEFLDLAYEIMGIGWITPTTVRIGASSLLDDLIVTAGDEP